MNKIFDFTHYICSWLIILICLSCANQVPPQGGPRDEDPPEIERTIPEHEQLRFEGHEVVFFFNEYIRPATYGKEIFISPLPLTRPKIVLVNKKLRIKFNEELRENTTYVITLTEIKDQNESNELEDSFTLAFSTGDILDSMKVKGKVYDKYIGKPLEGMTVMLFDADSIKQHDFFKIRPAYISKTNERGEFSFQNLRNAPFKAYGVVDVDQSNTYSQATEVIAISRDTTSLTFVDSTSTAIDTLYSFIPDDAAPIVLGYNWINDSVLISRHNEGILSDGLIMTMADTLGENPRGLSVYTYLGGNENELVIYALRWKELYSDLNFIGVRDSLGNSMDSVMRIIPLRTKDLEDVLIKPPTYNDKSGYFEFVFPGLLSPSDSVHIFLTDTFRVPIDTTQLDSAQIDSVLATKPIVPKISLEVDNFLVRIVPEKNPKPDVPFFLNISGKRMGTDDTTYTYMIRWPDSEKFGTLEGVLKMPSTYKGAIVMHLGKEKAPPVRTIYDTTYNFSGLKAGKYKVEVILDTDSNRVWTPGSLNPYRLPEQIYLHAGEIAIRANWEFEDYEIEVDLSKVEATPEEVEEGETSTETSPNLQGRDRNRHSEGSGKKGKKPE